MGQTLLSLTKLKAIASLTVPMVTTSKSCVKQRTEATHNCVLMQVEIYNEEFLTVKSPVKTPI